MATIAAGTSSTLYIPIAQSLTITPGTSGKVSLNGRNQDGSAIVPQEIYTATTIAFRAGATITVDAINVDATCSDVADSLSSVSGGGVAANTVAVLGDSRSAAGYTGVELQYNQIGFAHCLLAKLGQRLRLTGVFARGGMWIEDITATQIPAMVGSGRIPKWALIESGYNNLNGTATAGSVMNGTSARSADQTYSAFLACYTALRALGIYVIWATPQTGAGLTSAPRQQAVTEFARMLESAQATLDGLIVLDHFGVTVDTSTGAGLAARMQADLTHPNYEGAWQLAASDYAVLDPIIPRRTPFSRSVRAYDQLINNPAPAGNNAGGANGWTLAGSATGNGPNNWRAGTGGAGAGVVSVVSRSDNKAGTVARVTFSAGSSAADYVEIGPLNTKINSWSSGLTVAVGDRIRATSAQFDPGSGRKVAWVCTAAGNIATGADPTTGAWSTTIGTAFVTGGATIMCVQSIDVGDSVRGLAEITAANFNGVAGTALLVMMFYDIGLGTQIAVYNGNFADASYTLPSGGAQNGAQVIATPDAVIPAGTGQIIFRVRIIGQSGAVVDVGRMEIQPAY